jgi:hypothetical protein
MTACPGVTSSSSATRSAVSTRPRTEQAVAASSCHDGAGRARLRPAMAYEAEANGVGKHPPHDLGIGPSQAAGAVHAADAAARSPGPRRSLDG